MKSIAAVPLAVRFGNVPLAYTSYVGKTFWPENLCVLYPLPDSVAHVDAVVGATLFLLVTTLIFFGWRSKYPWLLMGWLFFLGTLVPVIGLVQVGEQPMADRYAYVPVIGLFLLVAYSLKEMARNGSRTNYYLGRHNPRCVRLSNATATCLLAQRRRSFSARTGCEP